MLSDHLCVFFVMLFYLTIGSHLGFKKFDLWVLEANLNTKSGRGSNFIWSVIFLKNEKDLDVFSVIESRSLIDVSLELDDCKKEKHVVCDCVVRAGRLSISWRRWTGEGSWWEGGRVSRRKWTREGSWRRKGRNGWWLGVRLVKFLFIQYYYKLKKDNEVTKTN